MTTNVTNPKIQPAIVMDKLHIDSLTFRQSRENDPPRVIGLAGCLYGLDMDGSTKVFDKESFSINDENMDATIIGAAIANGMTLTEFGIEYITAKSTINDRIVNGTLKDAELMAYFEAALGRMFELHGKVSISGVE